MNKLLTINPPNYADKPIVERMAKIGVASGSEFKLSQFTPEERTNMRNIPQTTRMSLLSQTNKIEIVNNWSIIKDTGRYGTDYLFRAFVAFFGIGANLPEDAIYLNIDKLNGTSLSGSENYTLKFDLGKTPPVNAFWSLTLYNQEGYFTENELRRYAIGDRSGLVPNDDGSVTIYIQNNRPSEDKVSNWLPAPPDVFNLTFRAYHPKEELLNGTWRIPSIEVGE